MPEWKTPFEKIKVGTGRKVKRGTDLAILTIGHIGNYALDAIELLSADGVDAALYDMRFVKPLDAELLTEVFENFERVITVEDGCIMGGMGSAVLEWMVDHGYSSKVTRLGIPDEFIEHGTQDELYAECNYDAESIRKSALELMGEKILNEL